MLRRGRRSARRNFKVTDYVSYCTVLTTGAEIYMRLTVKGVQWKYSYIVHTEYPE